MARRFSFLGFSFSLMFSFYAHAYPQIGDKVQWTGSMQLKSGESSAVHITKEVVSFDAATKKWKVKYMADVGGKVTTEFIEADELYTPTKHKKMISDCTTQGGVLEDVSTSIGKYQTCKMTTRLASGVVIDKWWGDIPFGVVGRNTTDSSSPGQPDFNAIAREL